MLGKKTDQKCWPTPWGHHSRSLLSRPRPVLCWSLKGELQGGCLSAEFINHQDSWRDYVFYNVYYCLMVYCFKKWYAIIYIIWFMSLIYLYIQDMYIVYEIYWDMVWSVNLYPKIYFRKCPPHLGTAHGHRRSAQLSPATNLLSCGHRIICFLGGRLGRWHR